MRLGVGVRFGPVGVGGSIRVGPRRRRRVRAVQAASLPGQRRPVPASPRRRRITGIVLLVVFAFGPLPALLIALVTDPGRWWFLFAAVMVTVSFIARKYMKDAPVHEAPRQPGRPR